MPRIARRDLASLALAVLALAPSARAADQPPLVLEAAIPLENTSGRIDHMAFEPRRGRLLVAELGNGTVDVVDLARRAVAARIGALKEPQGIAYAQDADLIAVASGGDGTVRFYRGEDLAPAGSLALGDDADNVRLDPRTGNLVVGYGRGALALIDPVRRAKLAEFRLPAHPESFQLDPARAVAFVNVPDTRQVVVVDLTGTRPPLAWRVPGPLGNFSMAYDAQSQELAIVTRSPPKLIVLDAGTGQVRTRLPACSDADDAFFDLRRQRLYVSCGEGVVATWQRNGALYRPLPPVRTGSGARTSLFAAGPDRLFVAKRAGILGSSAAILVFRPGD